MLNTTWMIVWSALVGAFAQDTGLEESEPSQAEIEPAAGLKVLRRSAT